MAKKASSASIRRAEISELVHEKGFVRIDDLADRFQVTPMTIHRDLDALNTRGIVSKVRSGATANSIEEIERNVNFRAHHMIQQKQSIAAAAAQWLADQPTLSVIALDDSTTALAMADHIAPNPDYTLVSNFLGALDRIDKAENNDETAKLIAIGGTYSPSYRSFNGLASVEAIRSVQIDVFFLSASSVQGNAIYTAGETALTTKRAFMDQSVHTVLLLDHTKFERRALHRQARFDELDLVVVDEGITPEHLRNLHNVARNVLVAPLLDI